jgi:hypothetical protein
MFLDELAEPQLLVIYPGRFQPFHKGHHAVFEYLTGKFGRNNVYIATSNKTDNLKSPFTFAEKSYFMQLTGVPADRIVQATQPYNIQDILNSGHISVANPENTVVIFAVSEKDMAEDPRFSSWTKKDGSPTYFQPLKSVKETQNMNQHGYIMTVPTFPFTVLGQPMKSASEIRGDYAQLEQESAPGTKAEFIKDLFGKYTREAEQIMNSKLLPAKPVEEPKLGNKVKLQKVPAVKKTVTEGHEELKWVLTINGKDVAHYTDECEARQYVDHLKKRCPQYNIGIEHKIINVQETAGVGVVKNTNDPRYCMATLGNQNNVNGETLGKEMKSFGLVGRSNPGITQQQKKVNKSIGKGLKSN